MRSAWLVVPVVLGLAGTARAIAGFEGTYRLGFLTHNAHLRKPDGDVYPPCPGHDLQDMLTTWAPLKITIDARLVVNGEAFQLDTVGSGGLSAHSKKNSRMRLHFGNNDDAVLGGAESRLVAILGITAHVDGRDCAIANGFMEGQ